MKGDEAREQGYDNAREEAPNDKFALSKLYESGSSALCLLEIALLNIGVCNGIVRSPGFYHQYRLLTIRTKVQSDLRLRPYLNTQS